MNRSIIKIAMVSSFLALSSSWADSALAKDAVMDPVKSLKASINSGKPWSPNTFTSSQIVVDKFAPFRWSGANEATMWAADFDAFAKAHHMTNIHVATQEPTAMTTSGNLSYAVLPTKLTGDAAGKPFTEKGYSTFVLTHDIHGWHISTFIWSTTK